MKPAMSQISTPEGNAPPAALPAAPARFAVLDLARGLALLAMFVFHFAYDLSHFQLIATDVPSDPGWRLFARLIAGSFLTIVGFSLVLATRNGVRPGPYLRRLGLIAGAAALVTVATWFAMRANFIFFGILHHIALASVLGLAFRRLPAPALAACAALVFAMPEIVARALPDALWLDAPWALWLGFSQGPLYTADYVPVFPWFGCVLSGIALAKLALPRLDGGGLARWRPAAKPLRLVAWGGRHSLPVYLLHQPVFIGLILLALQAGLVRVPEERPFLNACQRSCAETQAICARYCACMVESLRRTDDLWQKALAARLSPTEIDRAGGLAEACRRADPS